MNCLSEIFFYKTLTLLRANLLGIDNLLVKAITLCKSWRNAAKTGKYSTSSVQWARTTWPDSKHLSPPTETPIPIAYSRSLSIPVTEWSVQNRWVTMVRNNRKSSGKVWKLQFATFGTVTLLFKSVPKSCFWPYMCNGLWMLLCAALAGSPLFSRQMIFQRTCNSHYSFLRSDENFLDTVSSILTFEITVSYWVQNGVFDCPGQRH